MDSATHIRYTAADRSYLSILKKDVHKQAESAGFDEKKLNALDIIVAELSSNLVKYASAGELLAGVISTTEGEMFEVICIDKGPGIKDPIRMMEDGASTSGTLGQGLGAIKRQSDFFELYSIFGWGTIVISRLFKTKRAKPLYKNLVKAIVLAKPGQAIPGDGMYVEYADDFVRLLVADGLGHGPAANEAVSEGVKAFKKCKDNSPSGIIRYMHEQLKRTRGMVATVMVYDVKAKQWLMAGIGNIQAKQCGVVTEKALISYNGIIGHNIPNTIKSHVVDADEFQQMILCSDGIKTRWDHTKYPSILKHDHTVLAAALYKDFARQTDDMSVVIVKLG